MRNLASLPHISVAGACATATHGSGPANQNLAACITGMELVTAAGDLVELGPDDDSFAGAVVHLGALGVVVRLILDVVPSFEVSQWVYEDLPLEVLDDHFADIMSSGYSVSMFTDWRASRLTQIWVKQRVEDPAPPPPASLAEAPWFTAAPAPARRNPVPGGSPEACTEQLGAPARGMSGCLISAPSSPRARATSCSRNTCMPAGYAVSAVHALNQIRDQLAAVLQVCEFRVVAADELWLSMAYRRDSVAFHFTWIPDLAAVLPVVKLLEEQLAAFEARPHWGKVFTATPEDFYASYERLPDFLNLARHYDPAGKFRNAYTARYLGR